MNISYNAIMMDEFHNNNTELKLIVKQAYYKIQVQNTHFEEGYVDRH